MASKRKQPSGLGKGRDFLIEGQIQREQPECQPGDLRLSAYVFDSAGSLLGSAELDNNGKYSVPVRLVQPVDVELVVGPADMPQQIRQSSAYRQKFSAKDWTGEGDTYRLTFDTVLPLYIWRPWWPQRICISGHVRKISTHDGITNICPVPFVKVEIFDVDREPCFWPPLRKWWKLLLDRPVIRIPDLLKEPPIPPQPFPGPDPAPEIDLGQYAGSGLGIGASPGLEVSLNPQPLPPRMRVAGPVTPANLSPQQEVPSASQQSAFIRVGEARLMDSGIAAHLDRLTLTSKVAPWLTFAHCFYSTAEACETTTDCNGYFNCCFNWWPFHFRRGRLRFDSRPDIIIKVTQVINGVPTVIYMDPYTSTRWDVNNAHIDLFLDNEEVLCGSGCTPTPAGAATFFTLVGLDEVYKINQATGKFSNIAYGGSLANWAYGGWLLICALFGATLSSGAPKRYYRLSYKNGLANPADPNDNTGFVPITYPLSDTRVDKATFDTQIIHIGPQPPVNGVPNLYEIRNMNDYYWYNPDKIGWWDTEAVETDAGVYTLRLEVFNELGVKLTSADIDYRDGTAAPPGPLPAMVNRCDLVTLIDNRYPDLALTVPGASGTCGVVPFSAVPGLTVNISVNQPHGRLQEWGLSYVKGISGGSGSLAAVTDNSGITPLPVNLAIPAAPMTAGLTGTCAFSLTLAAWPLIRNGFGRIHYNHKTIAIAIEKCPPSP
jgi:hypothetical protein